MAGLATSNFAGCHIATQLGCEVSRRQVRYIPAYKKNGKDISACCNFTAFVNGPDGKSNVYDFAAWGKLADACAKGMSPGKEFHCTARPVSYEARVFNENREPMTKADGSPLTVRKTNFVITELRFGADSKKQIAAEIAGGLRPAAWNDGGEGSAAWATMRAAEKAKTYTGGPTYGHARVIQPTGADSVQQGAAATGNNVVDNLAAQVAEILKGQLGGQSASAGAGSEAAPW